MLVLSRRIGEDIVIADTIQVTVVGICRNRVQLGIIAPADVPVDRAEIHKRKREQDLAVAAGVSSSSPNGA